MDNDTYEDPVDLEYKRLALARTELLRLKRLRDETTQKLRMDVILGRQRDIRAYIPSQSCPDEAHQEKPEE